MSTDRSRLCRLAVAGVALILSAGCSVTVASGGPSSQPPAGTASTGPEATNTESTNNESATPGPPATTTGPTGIPSASRNLESVVATSTRPATLSTTRILGDDGSYEGLSLWAGCDGEVDQVVLDVAGYELLQGQLALRASAPTDIVAEVLILVDDEPVQNIRLDATNPVPALVPTILVLSGKQTVTTRTKVVSGQCAEAEDSYVVWVNGYVH